MNDSNRLVVFSIDEHRYALPLSTVERIVRAVEVTPLPKVPEIILGVVNVQGRIIPVLNIRKRFRLPEREMDLSDQFIIAHTRERSAALAVEKVIEVLEYPEQEVAAADEILPGIEYVEGIVNQENGMIQILNLDAILSFEEIKSLDSDLKERVEK